MGEKRKILITGASGVVATELISDLGKCDEFEIYAASRRKGEYVSPVHNVANEQLERCLQENEFDCLVHCAYPRNVDETRWASGISYAIQVLFLAKQYEVKRIVHISSQSIYGWKRTAPASEGDSICLNNPYGTGKYCIEQVVNQLFADRPHTNIRLSTVIGEHTEERVPNKLIHRLIRGENLQIQGGSQIFSFLDVKDAGEALCTLVQDRKGSWKETYNIGTDEYHSLLDIAEMCLSIARAKGNDTSLIETTPSDIVLNNRLDCGLFFTDFGWRAKHKTIETMERIYQSYL